MSEAGVFGTGWELQLAIYTLLVNYTLNWALVNLA